VNSRIRLLCSLLCAAAVSALGGYTINPPQIILNAGMGESMAWVEVVHTGGGPAAIELAVLTRNLSIDGEPMEGRDAPTDDFIVYPAQIILRAGEKAKVQVAYKLKGKVTADKAYTLRAKEVPLPVEDSEDKVVTGVTTLMNYYSVIAFETGKTGKLTFVSSKQTEKGKVELIMENKSNGRVGGEGLVLTIGGKEKIKNMTGTKNSIMPGQKRRFTFDYNRPLTAKEVSFGYR